MWNTKTNDYSYHIYLRKMKKLVMDWYGSIDIGGYVEYMSNLGNMAWLGFKFTEEDLLSGNPWKVDKPNPVIVSATTEESEITGESSFRVIRPYEDL